MTAAKDMSRPASSANASAVPSSLPSRSSYSRTHSHAPSIGSVNASTNRINRRKSSTFSPSVRPALSGAAMENAVAEASAAARRSSMSKAALASLNDTHPSIPSSLPHHSSVPENGSAIVDGPSLSSFPAAEKSKLKMRRASDGTHLSKKEKAAAGELKCEHCGKAYKHGSCLTKHLWEHTPQWQYTSKLLISKHQQVQLLEAASVLVAMNQDGPGDSDNSSSPAASGSSDMRDEELSSTETTPPPHSDNVDRDSKRFSNNSSVFSRSYQSVFSTGSVPNGDNALSHHHRRQWSTSSNSRPMTANTSIAESYRGDEDPQDLAAAVGLLSCSYGTPKSGPTGMPLDVPPVPPLPAKYQNQASERRGQVDVEMDDEESSDDEPHTRNDDMEYGMFGKMDA